MTTPPPDEPADDSARGGSSAWSGDEQQGLGRPDYGPRDYGQGYGPPAGPPAGAPPGGYGYGYAVPEHPKSTTAMILGIVGLVACQVLAPFALVIGKRTVAEIDASGGRWGGRGQAQAGYVLGIIGTVLLALSVLFLLVYLVIVVVAFGGVAMSGS